MKYRKKPVVIEAFQLKKGLRCDQIPSWFVSKICGDVQIGHEYDEMGHPCFYMEINTLEGVMRAGAGDYIIKGVKGEIYPCKEDIFEMTYEEVNE